jgi:hypothetical protein
MLCEMSYKIPVADHEKVCVVLCENISYLLLYAKFVLIFFIHKWRYMHISTATCKYKVSKCTMFCLLSYYNAYL